MDKIKVIKKDKSVEEWSQDKLIASMSKAGIGIKDAEKKALVIRDWVKENSKNGKISSISVRDKVIEQLMLVDPAAAEEYRVYKE